MRVKVKRDADMSEVQDSLLDAPCGLCLQDIAENHLVEYYVDKKDLPPGSELQNPVLYIGACDACVALPEDELNSAIYDKVAEVLFQLHMKDRT